MNVLLDENMSEELGTLLATVEASHVRSLGWTGVKNGKLLDLAESHGFDVFLTVDKQMRFQQNFDARRIKLIVLDIHPTSAANQIGCAPAIIEALQATSLEPITVIRGPHPSRSG